MTIEAGLLLAGSAGLIGLATFYIGRQSAAKKEGERWGKIEVSLQHMQRDILEVKELVAENARGYKNAIRRVHERLDAHLRDDHGAGAPRVND
jgi:hypothetical protein